MERTTRPKSMQKFANKLQTIRGFKVCSDFVPHSSMCYPEQLHPWQLHFVDGLERDLADKAEVVRLDVTTQIGRQAAAKYGVRGTPTVVVIDG